MGKNVTSAEFQKAFGRYCEEALREPVTITHHGRESLVLLSAGEYRRLKERDREALHVCCPRLTSPRSQRPRRRQSPRRSTTN